MENLNDLNKALFQTLNGVIDDKIDSKKAKSVVDISNSIISNHKLQLDAIKLAKKADGFDSSTKSFGLEKAKETLKIELKNKVTGMNAYDQSLAFSRHLGYKNTAEAISNLGSSERFNKEKREWLETL